MTNLLVPIMAWYDIIRDGMRVAARVIRKKIVGAITERHVFHDEDATTSARRLVEADQELDDLVVLSLVATFERTLRDHLQARATRLLLTGDPIDDAIVAGISSDIEYWRFGDRLIDVFKGLVGPTEIGTVRQIIGYRNWVAHGRAAGSPPGAVVGPTFAFGRPTRFLELAGIVELG